MATVIMDGVASRCQQCARFQPVEDFDGLHRTCRSRLARHNMTRHARGERGKRASRVQYYQLQVAEHEAQKKGGRSALSDDEFGLKDIRPVPLPPQPLPSLGIPVSLPGLKDGRLPLLSAMLQLGSNPIIGPNGAPASDENVHTNMVQNVHTKQKTGERTGVANILNNPDMPPFQGNNSMVMMTSSSQQQPEIHKIDQSVRTSVHTGDDQPSKRPRLSQQDNHARPQFSTQPDSTHFTYKMSDPVSASPYMPGQTQPNNVVQQQQIPARDGCEVQGAEATGRQLPAQQETTYCVMQVAEDGTEQLVYVQSSHGENWASLKEDPHGQHMEQPALNTAIPAQHNSGRQQQQLHHVVSDVVSAVQKGPAIVASHGYDARQGNQQQSSFPHDSHADQDVYYTYEDGSLQPATQHAQHTGDATTVYVYPDGTQVVYFNEEPTTTQYDVTSNQSGGAQAETQQPTVVYVDDVGSYQQQQPSLLQEPSSNTATAYILAPDSAPKDSGAAMLPTGACVYVDVPPPDDYVNMTYVREKDAEQGNQQVAAAAAEQAAVHEGVKRIRVHASAAKGSVCHGDGSQGQPAEVQGQKPLFILARDLISEEQELGDAVVTGYDSQDKSLHHVTSNVPVTMTYDRAPVVMKNASQAHQNDQYVTVDSLGSSYAPKQKLQQAFSAAGTNKYMDVPPAQTVQAGAGAVHINTGSNDEYRPTLRQAPDQHSISVSPPRPGLSARGNQQQYSLPSNRSSSTPHAVGLGSTTAYMSVSASPAAHTQPKPSIIHAQPKNDTTFRIRQASGSQVIHSTKQLVSMLSQYGEQPVEHKSRNSCQQSQQGSAAPTATGSAGVNSAAWNRAAASHQAVNTSRIASFNGTHPAGVSAAPPHQQAPHMRPALTSSGVYQRQQARTAPQHVPARAAAAPGVANGHRVVFKQPQHQPQMTGSPNIKAAPVVQYQPQQGDITNNGSRYQQVMQAAPGVVSVHKSPSPLDVVCTAPIPPINTAQHVRPQALTGGNDLRHPSSRHYSQQAPPQQQQHAKSSSEATQIPNLDVGSQQLMLLPDGRLVKVERIA